VAVAVGLLAAVASASSAGAAGSCTDSWLGGDGNWFVASNWSGGAVPGTGDAVCITVPGNYTVTVRGGPAGSGAGKAVADTLQLGAASGAQKLVIEADNSCGDATGVGGLEVFDHGRAATAASIGANGQVELTQDGNACTGSANGTSLRVDNGALSNAGAITTDTGGVAASAVTGRLIQGSMTNSGGTIEVEANTSWSGATFDNAGTLTFSGRSVLTVPSLSGATFINDAGGAITGGTLTGDGYLLVYSGNTFEQGAGTANPQWSRPGTNPAVIVDGGTLVYTGDGRSNIEVQGQATLVGDVPSQALLAIECSAGEDAVLHANSFANAGFIGLYGAQPESCAGSRTLSVDSSAGPGTGTLTNTGQIEGYGTIAGNVGNTSGSILAGDSFPPCTPCTGGYNPGEITVTGNYTQGSGATLSAVIVYSTSYSQLVVQGAASLDGTLEMLTGAVAHPYVGDGYQILTAHTVTGTFATLAGQLNNRLYYAAEYVPVYNPTNVTVGVVGLNKLAVTVVGPGSGVVISAPAGINCGVGCTAGFSQDQPVTLTAAPASGSRFAGWSGAGCSGTGTCALTIDGDQSVTAAFTFAKPAACTLRLKSRRVKLTARQHDRAKHTAGTLAATVACDQPASLRLSGTLSEQLGSRRKPVTKRFRLRPVSHTATQAGATTLVMTLPSAALKALEHGHRESIRLTLIAISASGTTRTSLPRLPLIGPLNRGR
jgi:hypothetical protein